MARPTPTWVYVMTCGEHAKIGIATDVDARQRNLQGNNPFKVEVYGAQLFENYSIARLVEMELHKEFAEHRGYGEWFKVDPEIALASAIAWSTKPPPRKKPAQVSVSQWRIMKALEF